MQTDIRAVLLGKVRPFRGDDELSAIGKLPVTDAVAVGAMGLAGDEQADRTVHGGIDKAIHHYPADHYGWWRDYLGDVALLGAPGAFGENISTAGLDEHSVFLGDRFRLGTALVEVTQARQPCWKLDHRFGTKGVMSQVVKTRRTGWYYRVLEPGHVRVGDAPPGLLRGLGDPRLAAALRQIHRRPTHPWTVTELAKEAALSRSAFFDRFARTVGVPPIEYLQGWRMSLAKDMLRRNAGGLTEIAERVGYGSASAFSTAFARHVGLPPKRYALANAAA